MLSIVICTLNEEQYLPKLLDSLLIQKGVDFEVIVSDCGSEDRTKEVVEKYQSESALDIKLILSERGIAKQRNFGAAAAKNQKLLFLDADVIVPPYFLLEAMDQIVNQKILVAGTRIYATEKDWNYRLMYWMYSDLYLPLVRIFNPVMHGCSIFSDKEIHDKIGGFREGLIFEDYRYGKDAAEYFRPPLLKKVFVRTSARRFYEAPLRSTLELFFGGIYTFFKPGIPQHYFKGYNANTGKHIDPKY